MIDDELEEIKKRKLEQLKKQYMNGGQKMEENMPNEPITMTDADMDENIKKYGTVVVDCWAPWCGPCRMVHPVVEELAKEMQGEVVFGKLNVDENREVASRFEIMSIPNLLVFKNGEKIDAIVGALPESVLEEKILAHK